MTEATYTPTHFNTEKPRLSVQKTPSRAARLNAFKLQMAWFYGDARGYFALDTGVRDDTAPTGIQMLLPSDDKPDLPNERTYHYYDPARPDLLELAAEAALDKAERNGNIYLTRTLFERRTTKKNGAKPSRIIAVEDAPEALPVPASRVLRTSPHSRQAFYRLVEAVSTAKAERLSRLIARVLGSDKSGTNANKVLRLVYGYNTKSKYGAPHLVTRESEARDYTYQELWEAYSAYLPEEEAAARETEAHERAAVRWPDAKERWVEHWSAHIGTLMDGRIPRVFKLHPTSQGYRIFGDDAYIAGWKHESGSWDASTVRWVRAANLIRSGYTDEMAAAVLEAAEHAETLRIKGRNAVRNDIRQVVTMAREQYGYERVGAFAQKRQPEYMTPAEGQAEEPNAGGRPAKLTADTVLAFLNERQEDGIVPLTRAEIARHFGVSPITITRLYGELKTRDEITVEHTPDRQRAFVRLTRLIKTSTPKSDVITRGAETLEGVETPQTAVDSPQAIKVTHVVLSPVSGDAAGAPAPEVASTVEEEEPNKMRSSQSTPEMLPAPRSLHEAITRELASRTVEKVNRKTGARYRGRAPFGLVLEAVRAHFPNVREESVRACYERLMRPIRREMRQESQGLTMMGYADDVVYDRLKAARGGLIAGARPKPTPRLGEPEEKHAERVAKWEKIKGLEWKYSQDVDRFAAELERRGLPIEPPDKRRRTRQEVLYQATILTVAPSPDEELARWLRAPLPTTRVALWEILETLSTARGVEMPTETLTLEALAERVEQLRSLALSA